MSIKLSYGLKKKILNNTLAFNIVTVRLTNNVTFEKKLK